MCGICGIINTKTDSFPDVHLLKRMMGRISHRGPDSSGYYRDKHVGLGHTRLSIIDHETGAQPISNEDDSVWIVFNGEIFNYIELSVELKKKGHTFKTKSDTEVIIHAYEEWGTACFERFNGQWAIALWDIRKEQVIFSRDRHGIRPLYYTCLHNRILFASEIKSLFADSAVERSLDPAGFGEIFTFWGPVAPRTVFKDIQELEPGNFAIIHKGQIKCQPYWSINFRSTDQPSNEKENADSLRDHLINSSKLRFTRSDVPVGAYLSGGIDSSITSSIVTNFTDAPLKTFSIRFKDSEFDEGPFQKDMINRLNSDHRDVGISYKDIGEVFPEVIWHTERPLLRTAPAPLYLLSKLVRESGYKVVVTGEGADEVLAGYDIFREEKVRQFLYRNPQSKKRQDILLRLYPWMERSPGQVPAFARAFFGKSLDPSDPGFSHTPRWDSTAALKLILAPDFKNEVSKHNVVQEFLDRMPSRHKEWDSLCRSQWLEMKSLLSGYILSAQGDRMLMANSIEGRFPFLDCNLVDFANQLEPRHKLLGLNEKHLLKVAFKDLVPKSILNRPKKPYRAPDAASFFNNGKIDWVDDLTSEETVKKAGIFNPKAVNKIMAKCRSVKGLKMSNTDNMRTVAILSTMLLHHHYIENSGHGGKNEIPPQPMTIIDKLEGTLNADC